jgi:signal transduction histidine kinase
VSVVSHELRTPLTSIRGSLGLLAAGTLGTLGERGQRMLQIATQNADRLVRLVNDILDLERLHAGQVELQRRTTPADALLQQAIDGLQGVAERAGVRMDNGATSVEVYADPDRVLQVLTNLLGNAVKFSPPGSVVRASAERRGRDVLFRVEDHGRGIPAEQLESVFERFRQVDASDARQKGGSGLGLAIARGIVQQHGGRIWAESVPGEGSTFHFTLPTAPACLAGGEPRG